MADGIVKELGEQIYRTLKERIVTLSAPSGELFSMSQETGKNVQEHSLPSSKVWAHGFVAGFLVGDMIRQEYKR